MSRVIGALRRNGKIDFVHVRREEFGVFAAITRAVTPNCSATSAEAAGWVFNGNNS